MKMAKKEGESGVPLSPLFVSVLYSRTFCSVFDNRNCNDTSYNVGSDHGFNHGRSFRFQCFPQMGSAVKRTLTSISRYLTL